MPGGERRPRERVLRLLPWVVVGGVMVALASVAVVRLFVDEPAEPDDASSVRSVADLAQEVTEALDVAGGTDLLCEPPIDLYRMAVESTIASWQTLAGTPSPAITAEVSDVDAGAAGSFVIRISSDEDGLEDERRAFRVFVESRDGRSCVTGVGGVGAKRPTTRFASEGYSPATSPTPQPTPRPTPRATPSAVGAR